MKRLLIGGLLSLILPAVFAAKGPQITFAEKEHDFGLFSEKQKQVTCVFRFTNTGDAPLVIIRTIATCGCTKPSYTEEPVAPGGKGEVRVTYNAEGRPGDFQKMISVFANTTPSKTVLTIKGTVVPGAPVKHPEYAFQAGDVRLKNNNFAFFDITDRQTKKLTIGCYNESKRPVTLYFRDVPSHLTVRSVPERIPADGEGEIEVAYSGARVGDWGERDDTFLLSTRPDDPNPFPVVVSANIVEDFERLSEADLQNAPELSLASPRVDFGQLESDERVERTLRIANRGKRDLLIRKLEPNARFIKASVSRTTIPAGKSVDLKVTVEPTYLKGGLLNNQILLISNDPAHPVTRLRVVGYFKE